MGAEPVEGGKPGAGRQAGGELAGDGPRKGMGVVPEGEHEAATLGTQGSFPGDRLSLNT